MQRVLRFAVLVLPLEDLCSSPWHAVDQFLGQILTDGNAFVLHRAGKCSVLHQAVDDDVLVPVCNHGCVLRQNCEQAHCLGWEAAPHVRVSGCSLHEQDWWKFSPILLQTSGKRLQIMTFLQFSAVPFRSLSFYRISVSGFSWLVVLDPGHPRCLCRCICTCLLPFLSRLGTAAAPVLQLNAFRRCWASP